VGEEKIYLPCYENKRIKINAIYKEIYSLDFCLIFQIHTTDDITQLIRLQNTKLPYVKKYTKV